MWWNRYKLCDTAELQMNNASWLSSYEYHSAKSLSDAHLTLTKTEISRVQSRERKIRPQVVEWTTVAGVSVPSNWARKKSSLCNLEDCQPTPHGRLDALAEQRSFESWEVHWSRSIDIQKPDALSLKPLFNVDTLDRSTTRKPLYWPRCAAQRRDSDTRGKVVKRRWLTLLRWTLSIRSVTSDSYFHK